MKYHLDNKDVPDLLSEDQKQEILDRDEEFEAGNAEAYSLAEIIDGFGLGTKSII